MKAQFTKIKTDLETLLPSGPDHLNSAEDITGATALIDKALAALKAIVLQEDFENTAEEIKFFKFFKPEILAVKIALIYKYNLRLNEPVGTSDSIIQYYESELSHIQSFFRINAFHHQYFRNHLSNMDQFYFIRNAGPLDLPIEEISDLDPVFSTQMSLLFAKFMGYQAVQDFCLQRITEALEGPVFPVTEAYKDDMKWTGDSINIVELAYGIYLTGQLNNGNASLNQIVKWLENNLHVKIGIVQKRFSEISKRKRLSQTKFIDQMQENIRRKIDENNA
jgi:hypothetical protein